MYFFEVQVKYQRQTGEENPGNVTETYMVESINPGNAEARVIEEIKSMIFGEHEVPKIIKRKIYDLFTGTGDHWFKAAIEIIVINDSGFECRAKQTIMVQGSDISDAIKRIKEQLPGIDFEIISIAKSPVLEVYRATK